MRNSRKYRMAALGIALSASAVLGTQTLAQAQETESAPRYQPEMVRALAASLGVSEKAATERLDRQAAQQARLAALTKSGIAGDGAFFDRSGTLTVNVGDKGEAAKVEKAGLAARVPARGQAALDKVKSRLDALAAKKVPSGVASWSVDLASDKVTVKVSDERGAAAKAFLAKAAGYGAAVEIVRGQEQLEAKAAIYPGSKMTLNNTTGWCSVGYGAHDSSGRQYLVSAGHCIVNTLRYDGTAFAQGYNTRYKLGSNSVDMGIATVNSGHSIVTAVGTWNQGSTKTVAVKGSSRAAVGAAICKSGATTGWTCGSISSYNNTVTYVDRNGGPDTVITGLGASSVCVEGGDSGGAYISGNQAQGMTSGGPTDQQCTGGVNSRGSSYFQPLGDALQYYGLTLNTN